MVKPAAPFALTLCIPSSLALATPRGHLRMLAVQFQARTEDTPVVFGCAGAPSLRALETMPQPDSTSSPLLAWGDRAVLALAVLLLIFVMLNLGILFILLAFFRRQRRELLVIQLREARLYREFLQTEALRSSPPIPPPPLRGALYIIIVTFASTTLLALDWGLIRALWNMVYRLPLGLIAFYSLARVLPIDSELLFKSLSGRARQKEYHNFQFLASFLGPRLHGGYWSPDGNEVIPTAPSNICPFCDEIFVRKDQNLLVSHSSQYAYYSNQRVNEKTKRKLYWQYIATHYAHTGKALKKYLPEAHKLALVYLKWCALEALTSSESKAKIPFPLKHSQELANILKSLSESEDAEVESEDSPVLRPEEGPVMEVEAEAIALEPGETAQAGGSSQPMQGGSDDEKWSSFDPSGSGAAIETAAEESRKLRVALIAKVLAEKYCQQDAVDTSAEIDLPPAHSRTLDGLFWVVDVASLGSFLRYLNRLEEVRATILTDEQWRDHILRLVKEWEEFNLISTVLLSASAGILALPSISGVPRTAILISILSSFGSVTTGLYCISMYQLRTRDDRDSAGRTNELTIFNYNQYTSTHKGIAFILGLPMAFLVWSLIAFMTGILSYNIVGTEIAGHVSGVAYAVISVAAAVFLLIAIAFYSLTRLWGAASGQGSIVATISRIYQFVFWPAYLLKRRRSQWRSQSSNII
ncbi:hypothetical protein GGX14DRAFT_671695 [Mycena pura]|uniref:Uncharacterized protein n=1 Tax=Mycena pura TaxID=153505 RepID=A0AAD6Y538_9AGAR|nr:hypothetical protein GGX14DRAFT_671695 [Mycena pura]